jgi:hypothetical protein
MIDTTLFDMCEGGRIPYVEAGGKEDLHGAEEVYEHTLRFQRFSTRNVRCHSSRFAVVIKAQGETPSRYFLWKVFPTNRRC